MANLYDIKKILEDLKAAKPSEPVRMLPEQGQEEFEPPTKVPYEPEPKKSIWEWKRDDVLEALPDWISGPAAKALPVQEPEAPLAQDPVTKKYRIVPMPPPEVAPPPAPEAPEVQAMPPPVEVPPMEEFPVTQAAEQPPMETGEDRLQRLLQVVNQLQGAEGAPGGAPESQAFQDLARGVMESTKGNLFGGPAPDYSKIFPAAPQGAGGRGADPMSHFIRLLGTVGNIDNQAALRSESERRLVGAGLDRSQRKAKFLWDVTKEAAKFPPEIEQRMAQGRAVIGPQLQRTQAGMNNPKVVSEVTGLFGQFIGSPLPQGFTIEKLFGGGVSAMQQASQSAGFSKVSPEAWGLISDLTALGTRFIFDMSGKQSSDAEQARLMTTYFNRSNPEALREGFKRFKEDMIAWYNGYIYTDRKGLLLSFVNSLEDPEARARAYQVVSRMPEQTRPPPLGSSATQSHNPRAAPPLPSGTPVIDPDTKTKVEQLLQQYPGAKVMHPKGDISRLILVLPDGTTQEVK